MPVGRITEELPRKATAFDLNRGRGPNSGTVWAGSEPDPNALIDTGDPTTPGRFTQYSTADTPKGDPSQRPVQLVLDERGFDCAVCNLNFKTMETFNAHCVPDPRGNGKEIRCEVDKRLFEEKNAAEKGHMIDPNSVAVAVAEALKPTLLSIVGAFERVNETLERLSGKPEKKPKKEGKKRGRARMVRGNASPGGPAPVDRVGQPEEPVADPSTEPEASA